jgi:hypothetical protein
MEQTNSGADSGVGRRLVSSTRRAPGLRPDATVHLTLPLSQYRRPEYQKHCEQEEIQHVDYTKEPHRDVCGSYAVG